MHLMHDAELLVQAMESSPADGSRPELMACSEERQTPRTSWWWPPLWGAGACACVPFHGRSVSRDLWYGCSHFYRACPPDGLKPRSNGACHAWTAVRDKHGAMRSLMCLPLPSPRSKFNRRTGNFDRRSWGRQSVKFVCALGYLGAHTADALALSVRSVTH